VTVDPGGFADSLARMDARKKTAAQYAQTLTPAQRGNVTGLANTFPGMGVSVVPLGAAGVTPDHPLAHKVATAALTRRAKQIPQGKQVTGGWASKFWHGIEEAGSAVKDQVLKPVVKYGSAGLMAPYELVKFGVAGTAADLGLTSNDGTTGDSWGDAFDFNAWVESVDSKINAQAEEIAGLLLKVADLESRLNDSTFIGTPPAGAFLPRNRRRFNV